MDEKIVLVLAIGLVAGGVAGYTVAPIGSGQGDASNDVAEGLAVADSSPMCLGDADLSDSGWVHTVATGEQYGVTFDVAISHAQDEHASIELNHVHGDEYNLAISTGEASEEGSEPMSEADCDVGTRFSGGGELPADYDELTVTVNGEQVAQMKNEGTTPRLERLETPIEA